jgi:hypothetical protein
MAEADGDGEQEPPPAGMPAQVGLCLSAGLGGGDRAEPGVEAANARADASDGEWLLPASWRLQHRVAIRIRNKAAELFMAAGAFYRA